MKKSHSLALVLLAGVICFVVGYGFGKSNRPQDRVAAFQFMMGWDDAQMTDYLNEMQAQMTPAEAVEMAVWLRDHMQSKALHFEEDRMVTTITCIFVLKWLTEGKEDEVKEYCIRRIVSAYNTPLEDVNPELRETYQRMRESVEKLAANVPELQKALADSLPAAPTPPAAASAHE